jgi:hypothetical protein
MDAETRKHFKRLIDMDMDRTDDVSVQRYTRKGNLKKPTGVNHPNSLMALERHRTDTQFGGSKTRRCKKCKRLAVRELEVCYWHGGKAFLRVKRRLQGKGAVGKTSDIAVRNTRRVFIEQGVPAELMHNPLFAAVGRIALPKIFGVSADEYKRIRQDIPLRIASRVLVREMVAAWYAQQEGDYKPWLIATTKARNLGFGR